MTSFLTAFFIGFSLFSSHAVSADRKAYFVGAERPKGLGERAEMGGKAGILRGGYVGRTYVDVYLSSDKSTLNFEIYVGGKKEKRLLRKIKLDDKTEGGIAIWRWLEKSKSVKILNVSSDWRDFNKKEGSVVLDPKFSAEDVEHQPIFVHLAYELVDGAQRQMDISWAKNAEFAVCFNGSFEDIERTK